MEGDPDHPGLTLEPHIVDDLAALPLDVWAAAQGYTRPCPNPLRV